MSIFKKTTLPKNIKIDPLPAGVLDGLRGGFTFTDESLYKKAIEETKNEEKVENNEEWVWVTGYKGTRMDMCCRNYKYVLNQQHNMADDEAIRDCQSGFHLCLKLEDVFRYYNIGEGHRFFEVSALVRKSDLDEYGKQSEIKNGYMWSMFTPVRDKLAAKSIVFLRELTPEEIFEHIHHDKFTLEEMEFALSTCIDAVYDKRNAAELLELGFSEPVAMWLVEHDKVDFAKTIMSQEGVSLDTKMLIIFTTDED